MEIKFNELTQELKEQAENMKIRLKGDFFTVFLYVHLALYGLRMTLLILRYFNIV